MLFGATQLTQVSLGTEVQDWRAYLSPVTWLQGSNGFKEHPIVTCLFSPVVPAVPMATELLKSAQVSGGCVSRPLLQTTAHIFFRYLVTGYWRVTRVRDPYLYSKELPFRITKERASRSCADSSILNSLEVKPLGNYGPFGWL